MEIKDPTKNDIFQVMGPSNKEGKVLVKAWDGNTYRIPETMDTNTFAEKLRSKKGPGLFGAISAATSYSIPQIYRTTLASVYDAFGMEEDQKEQEKLAQENQDLFNKVAGQYAIPSFKDVDSLGEASSYVQQQIGFSAPQMVGSIGGAAVGAAYGAPLIGGAIAAAPFFYAQNVDRQRQEKQELSELGIISDIEYDQGKALLAAGVQAGLEGVVGKVLFHGNQITKNLTSKLGYTPGTKASQSFLKTMGAVAATNAITEVGQQFAERWQADLPLLDDEAKNEYLEAGVAAAVVGIPLGSMGHFARRPATEQDAEQVVEAIDAEPVSPSEEPVKERNPLLMQLEEAIGKQTEVKIEAPPIETSPKELLSTLFNVSDDNQSYGIENVEQAKEYIASLSSGPQYLESLEKSNVSDGILIESARNNARLQEQQKRYSTGIEGQSYGNRGVVVDSENIKTQYSDEPRILNMAAILQSKYGFDRNHLKGLSDPTIEKLFRIYTDKDEQKTKPLPKPEQQKLLPAHTPEDKVDLPEAPRTPGELSEPDSLPQDYAAPSEIPGQPDVAFQKQLLDPEVGNDVADAEYVRKVNEEAPLKELRKIADKLDRIEKANKEASPENIEKKRKAEKILKDAVKKPIQKDPVVKKEKFKKAAKEKPVDTDVPVAPNDLKLDTPIADKNLVDRKETILNETLANQLREPKKYNKDLNLQGVVKGFLDGSLYETARINYGNGSNQVDLFVFDQFIKTNFKPSNIKSLVDKHKVLLSSKLGILPKDLAFWGDTFILHQGLQEFTQNKDKAFGNDIFKRFLDEQKKIKDYFNNVLKIPSMTSTSSAESAIKADKILKETPINEAYLDQQAKEVKKTVDKIDNTSSTNNSNFQWATSLLASMKGMARTNKNCADALNVVTAKKDFANALINDFATTYKSYFDSPNFDKFFNTLALMKETEQEIQTNKNGEIVFKDAEGKLKKFDKLSSAEFIRHSDMWKHFGRKYLETVKERLNDFQEIGLSDKSTPTDVTKVIAGLEEQIKSDTFSKDIHDKAKLQLAPLKDALSIYLELDRMQKENRPYVPFVRFGDYAVKVTDLETGKMVHLEDFERPTITGIQGLATTKEIDAFISKNANLAKFKDKKKYKIDSFQLTYNNINTPNSFITAELMAGVLGSSNPNLWTIIQDDKSDANADLRKGFNNAQLAKERALRYAMSKGGSKFLSKSENIPGYSKDARRVLQHHTEAMARLTATIKTAPEYAKVFKDVQLGQMPQWQRDQLNQYLEYNQSPKADYPLLRAFNFLYTMGLNVSTAALQLVTIPTHIMPAMHETGFNPISDMSSVLKQTTRAGSHLIYSKDPENLPNIGKYFRKDEVDFIRRHKEVLQASQAKDALGMKSTDTTSVKGRIKNTAEEVTNFAGIMIDRAERASRYGMALALYNKLRNNPNGVAIFENMHKDNLDWQSFKKNRKDLPLHEAVVHYQVRDVHGIFGKEGRGYSQRGALGSAVFPFTTYVGQALERMYDLGVNRGYRGKAELAQILGTYVLLAGLAGIPGYELAEELSSAAISEITGIKTSVRKDIREYVEKNGLDPVLVEKGILSTGLDIDVSNRIGLQLVVGRLISDAYKLQQGKDVDIAAYNPTLGLLPRIGEVRENMARNKDFLETINPVLPTALRNVNTAIGYANEKMLETKRGNPFPLEEPLGILDVLNKGAGFNPLQVAEARDALFFGKSFEKGKYTLIKDRYAEQIARLKVQAMKEPGSAIALNKQVNQLYNELLATLKADPDFKPTPDFFNGFNRSINNRIKERQNPKVNVQ